MIDLSKAKELDRVDLKALLIKMSNLLEIISVSDCGSSAYGELLERKEEAKKLVQEFKEMK